VTARGRSAFERVLAHVGLACALFAGAACSKQAANPAEANLAVSTASLTSTSWPTPSLVVSNSISLGSSARVEGDVAATKAATGAVLGSAGIELTLGTSSTIVGAARADSMSLAAGSSITGNAAYNTRTGTGTVGSVTQPLTLPLPITIPALPTITPGTTNVTVTAGATSSLAAGAYKTVTINANGRLTLTGGLYQLQSLTGASGGRVECSAACEVRVSQPVSIGVNGFFGHASTATLALSDIQLLIAATTSTPTTTPGALGLGSGSSLEGYVLAPNGTIRLDSSAVVTGKLVARDVLFATSAIEHGAPLPTIVTQPQDVTVDEHHQAVFTVVASGGALTYRWRKNGTDLAGATTATLAFEALGADNGAGFSVVVANNAGSLTSRTALLNVATCAASDATCNGIDDDCSGQTDEDYVGTPTTCGVGACAATGTSTCVAGAVTSGCTPRSPLASTDTTCNGVDDDCDGSVDEDYVPLNTTCGVGACAAAGRTSCVSGHVVDSCHEGTPGASDATCDGIDADCDGHVDDDYVPHGTVCGIGACAAAGVTSCVGGVERNSCTPGTPAAADTLCNGVDDDCDGVIDEDYVSHDTFCGVGACASAGHSACVGGVEDSACSPGIPAASDASCNGIDDDCDGQRDENYAPVATSCGIGACARTGMTSCQNGAVVNSCTAGTPAASDASCDGSDDDCDGQKDEDYAGTSTTCGVGSCRATGVTSCVGGHVSDSCQAGTAQADDSVCDGVDADCDGQTDEDYVPTATTCGVGACHATGQRVCVGGHLQDNCTPAAPAASDTTCDGVDDDCSGQADEDYVATATSCGVGACTASGMKTCVNGALVDSCAPGTGAASDTTCDGVDDDCDGSKDEDYVATATSCGVGACKANGTRTCAAGQPVDSCTPGTPAASDTTCDGVDDDCDGSKDEDYVATATSCGVGACRATGSRVCSGGGVIDSCTPGTPTGNDADCDGVDNDCDGNTDEGFVVACTGDGVLRCVNSALQTTQCSDGNPCNGQESCSAGACVPGTPPALSDGNPCTNDHCDPSTGVVHDPLPPGSSCGSARACDSDGVCIGAPVISEQPHAVSVSPGQPYAFSVTATGSGLSYQWKRFGQVIPGATAPTYAGPAATLADNAVEFTVVVQNSAGAVTSASATLTVVDSGGPVLVVDGPAERSVDTDLVTLTGSATDAASGVTSVVVRSDRFNGPVAAVLAAGTGVFSAEVPLSVGANALSVIATDMQGNQSTRSVLVTLTLTSLPHVSITEPAAGSTTDQELVSVRGSVRSSLAPESIRLVLGTDIAFPTGSGGDYTFEFANVRLTTGQNVLTVRAETSVGSVTAQTVVTFARAGQTGGTAPVIRVTGAQSEQFVSASSVPVKGTVTAQSSLASVTVNGQAATLVGVGSEVSFEANLTLPPGDNPVPVTIEARDDANRVGTLGYTVLHDDVSPLITTSLSPDPDVHAVTVTPYTVTGTISEPNLAGVSANNQSMSVLPGTLGSWDFSIAFSLVRGQDDPLVIEAWDRAGNRSQRRVLLHFDGSFGIEPIAPQRGAELLATGSTLQVDVVARAQGLAPDQVLTARVDGGGPVALSQAGSTFTGSVTVAGTTAAYELDIEVRTAGGQVLEQAVSPFSVKAAADIPLTALVRDPPNGAQNVEANQVVLIELSRPVDPSELSVAVRETVHGKSYPELASGAGVADYTQLDLVDLNRDDAAVPGGVSYLPGDRVLAFYPTRQLGYGANVTVELVRQGSELMRSSFSVRPLPTLISGFVADQFLNPLEGMEVQLDGSGVSAFTNREGAFSFGFGKFADAIPGGRHLLVVNPGMRNKSFGTTAQWVFTQNGRLQDVGIVRAPLLGTAEPFRHIASSSQASLLNGALALDLTQATLTFPNGQAEGDVHAELVVGPLAYASQPISVPFFTYALQPMGVAVAGTVTVDLALPEEQGNATYIDALPERVLLSGLDPRALELVPVGVGHVDKQARRIRSEGVLDLERLDFVSISPNPSAAAQKLLLDYAQANSTLPALVAGLEALR
jgi:hypothetical protein